MSDQQLRVVMDVAATIDPERRDEFLQRVASALRIRYRFNDIDVIEITQTSLVGLVHARTPERTF
jgi:hypothetical protein